MTMRRPAVSATRFAAVGIGTAGLILSMLFAPAEAAAHPSTDSVLTYDFYDCQGPVGTPATFEAVKQPSNAAALHLVDGSAIFVAVEATDVATGTVLFSTPGFDHNGLPTIHCLIVHPVSGALQSVTGMLAPPRS